MAGEEAMLDCAVQPTMASSDTSAPSATDSPPSPSPAPPAPLQSLQPLVSSLRVSSVLGGNVREYGKQRLFDPSPDSCWNSEQGSPQCISLTFRCPVDVAHLRLAFQGGFVGRPCEVALQREGGSKWEAYDVFDTRDDNSAQTFHCSRAFPSTAEEEGRATAAALPCRGVVGCRLRFPASTDFFGRVTVYSLDLVGRPTER